MSTHSTDLSQGLIRPSRRGFLGAAALAATSGAATLSAPRARANPLASDNYEFDVQRTEAEWREMLTDAEYSILR